MKLVYLNVLLNHFYIKLPIQDKIKIFIKSIELDIYKYFFFHKK